MEATLGPVGPVDDRNIPLKVFNHLKRAYLRLDLDISAEAVPKDGKYDEDLLQVGGAHYYSLL